MNGMKSLYMNGIYTPDIYVVVYTEQRMYIAYMIHRSWQNTGKPTLFFFRPMPRLKSL